MIVEKHSRLPRKYEAQPPAEDKPQVPIIADGLKGIDPLVILERYLSDESTLTIAASYNVTRQALSKHMLIHAESEWKGAQVARAIARKEKAEDNLELACDPLALAKARELLKAAQWDLERTCRRIYGEEVQKSDQLNPVLNIVVSGEKPALIQVALAHAQVLEQKSVAGEQQTQCNNGVVSDTSGS